VNKFSWTVSVGQEKVLPYLADVKMGDFFLKLESCVKSFQIGRKRVKEIFNEEANNNEITLPNVSGPHLSYGHLACLGAKIIFPEDSEPAPNPFYSNIKEGINALKRKVDFKDNLLFQHYQKMCNHLQKKFPEEKVGFSGFGHEGPITSAVLLRGQNFFLDIYDHPGLTKEFLNLLTQSIIEFVHFSRKLNSQPEIDKKRSGLADDFSSLISPSLWPEFVVPYWEKYYRGITTGSRTIHVENLNPEHLKYLEEVGIIFYDPSDSPKLTPNIIRERINIPFMWRLHSFQIPTMSKEDIRNWVFQTVDQGASHIYTGIDRNILEGDNPDKIRAFIKAAKEAKND